MDRKDGDVHMCCASIEKKLDVPAVLLQLPAVKDGKLFGRYYLFYTWKIKLCFKIINQNQKTWSKECMATMQTLSAVTQFTLIKLDQSAGTVDVLSLELIDFGKGKGVTKVDLNEKDWPELYADAQQYRVKLIEQLSDLDDDLAGKVITSESFDNVCSSDVVKAIQKVTLNRVSFLHFA